MTEVVEVRPPAPVRERVRLTLGWTTFTLDVEPEVAAEFAAVRAFFRDAMVADDSGEPASFIVRVVPWDEGVLRFAMERGERIVLRRSSAAPFNFDAWRAVDGDRWTYANEHTQLHAPRVCGGRGDRLTIAITAGSTHQVVDLLRDLAWRHEEQCGRVVLHASGFLREGGVVAVAGPKGAGKTTTLLTALADPRHRYFSGDKVVCDVVAGELVAAPWPDWPYVGVGSIRACEPLAEQVRATDPAFDTRGVREKLLLDPADFARWFPSVPLSARPRLAGLLLPRVEPGRPYAARAVRHVEEKWAHLLNVVDRTSGTTFFTAQLHLVPSHRAAEDTLLAMRRHLPGVAMTEVTGDLRELDVDAALPRTVQGGVR
jgi:hypothetical protein